MSVYRLTINKPGYLPENEPIDYTSLRELKLAIAEQIREFAPYLIWHKWEQYWKLTKSDFIEFTNRWGGLTIGLFYFVNSSSDIADYAVSVAYVPEEL